MPKSTILAEILDRTFGLGGPGPVYTCRKLSWTYRRDAAGHFRAEFPASDTMLKRIVLKQKFLRFRVGGVVVFLGLVEHMQRSMDAKGKQLMVIEGRCQLGVLAENTVGNLVIAGVEGPEIIVGKASVPNQTMILSLDGYDSTAFATVRQFTGESPLAALSKLAEELGEHFRAPIDASLSVVWMRTDAPPAPVRAVASGGPLLHENPDVIIIEKIVVDYDGEGLINVISPYGAGTGGARLSLAAATISMPAGFTMDTVANTIEYSAGQIFPSIRAVLQKQFPAIGKFERSALRAETDTLAGATVIVVDETITYPIASGTLLDLNGEGVNFVELSANVTPGANVLNVVATGFDVLTTDRLIYSNPDALEEAANSLAQAALAYLMRMCNPDNMVMYSMTVRGLPDSVHVGMVIPVQSAAPGFAIDDDLIIVEIQRSVDRSGRQPAVLKVVPAEWFDHSRNANIAAQLENSREAQALAQPTSYSALTETPSIPANFTDLGDVPASYSGAGGEFVKVKAGEDGLEFAAGSGGAVDSVNGQTGVVLLNADDIDDSATTNKFTSASEISKLAGIAAGAEVNVNADWTAVAGDAEILNKPSTFAPSAHASSHQHSGSDEVATATPANNAIPKANGSGKLADGWINALWLALTGGTMAGPIAMGTSKITGLGDPTAAQDAATKAYVDTVASGLDVKASVRVATTGNITLSGAQTIDGVSVIAGDRVLVKDQSTAANNGIYVAAAGAWSRATDADASAEVTSGLFTMVNEGTANGNSGWVLTTDDPITVGTTALTFSKFFSLADSYVRADGTTPLTADWDLGEDRAILAEFIKARDGEGITIYDDGGNILMQIVDAFGLKIYPLFANAMFIEFDNVNVMTDAGNTFTTGFQRGSAAKDILYHATRTNSSQAMMSTSVNGDTVRRFVLRADGQLIWGSGALTRDTNLFRNAADVLKTDDSFVAAANLSAGIDVALAKLHIYQATLGNAVSRLESEATADNPLEDVYQNRVATTNNTVTVIHTFAITASTTYAIEFRVVARRTGGSSGTAEDGYFRFGIAVYKNVAGTATILTGTTLNLAEANPAAWGGVDLNVSGSNVQLRVTGATNNNITWHMTAKVYPVSS